MVASPRIFLILVLLAVISSIATSNGIQGSAGIGFEAGVATPNEQQGENSVGHSESRFRFPGLAGIFFRGGNNANPEEDSTKHQIGPNEQNYDNTEGERKFRWPIPIPFFRSGEQNLEQVADYHTGPNRLSHEDPQYAHSRSANNGDTDNERKFPRPSAVSFHFKRSNVQNSELGADTDHIGQNGLNQEHHHHYDSAGNNDTEGERKFHWPSSITIGFRSNEQNSDEVDEAKFFGLIPSLAPCNHTEQAGRSCYDCTHTLLCFANDIAIKRDCSPMYCNQGRCAVEPSVECSPST